MKSGSGFERHENPDGLKLVSACRSSGWSLYSAHLTSAFSMVKLNERSSSRLYQSLKIPDETRGTEHVIDRNTKP